MDQELQDLWRTAFRVSYGIFGTVPDAEDVAQETIERWIVRDRREVRHPRAYVARIAGNRSIDRLRSVKKRREDLRGDTLPEVAAPETFGMLPDGVDLNYALITALQALTAVERAVFLLRDGFDCSYAEISDSLGKSAETCRQAQRRARRVLRTGRDPGVKKPDDGDLFHRILSAIEAQDLNALRALLADDVVLRTDNGGRPPSLRRPLVGADAVARFLIGARTLLVEGTEARTHRLGQNDAVCASLDGVPVFALIAEAAGHQATALYAIAHKPKIARLLSDV